MHNTITGRFSEYIMDLLKYFIKSIIYIKKHGIIEFVSKVKEKAFIYNKGNLYKKWVLQNEPDEKELKIQKGIKFNYSPKISIITPVYNTPEIFLIDMMESVINQTYPHWELCIADGGSNKKHIKETLENYKSKDKRIKVKYLSENKGISINSNEGISLATGEFITFLDHDDTLVPFALFEVVKAINENDDVDFIYSDEDKISEDGKKRFDPHFKPDWSPDTLRSYNYPIHLSVFKRDILEQVGYFREGYDGSQDYDIILRVTEKAKKIIHIPKVLYHWRISKFSTAWNQYTKMYAFTSAKKALQEHVERLYIDATVMDGSFFGVYRVKYKIENNPLISIIIPNKDHSKDLEKCIKSITKKSSYKNFEIIIIENNSFEQKTFTLYDELKKYGFIKIIEWNNKPFNYSQINNFAVKYVSGEILLFLNNDTEVINSDWLECMLEHIIRQEVGAVGAKLYYPDNTIQHAGIIVGVGGVAGHSHKYFPGNSYGYFSRLKIIQNLSAVTGACLMVRKDVFNDIGGFDDKYSLALNDVDFCLKLREQGYVIIWTPYAELYHYESKSRGYENTIEKKERFKEEIRIFNEKWKDLLAKGDPFYNINLTLEREDFSIKNENYNL